MKSSARSGTVAALTRTVDIAAYVLAIASGAFLLRFELNSDDAGIIALFILLSTCFLGSLRPRHAWQWALLVAPAVPLADLLFRSSHLAPGDTARLAAFVLSVGLVGAYLGVLLRKTAQAALDLHR